MKILVTGSAGFIGGYLVEELLANGYDVLGLDNFSKYGDIEHASCRSPRYRLVRGDAKDVELQKELLRDCDHMIAGAFPALLAEIERHIPQPFVLYVVYDFDLDSTVPVVRAFAQDRPWLRPVRNRHGRGVVAALRTGFQQVGAGPALVIMADLSDDLAIVPQLMALYRRGNRVVCPSRYVCGGRQLGGPLVKRVLSRAAGLSLRLLAGFPTHDATNNFRLYDAALVNELGIESSGGFELALELTAKAHHRGVKMAEVPTTWRDRTAGESRFKLMKWLPKYLYWYGNAFFGGSRH